MAERNTSASRYVVIGGARLYLSELGFVLIVTGFILLLTTVPYIYADVTSPPDRVFMGILLNVPDTAQYFSWMRGSIEGFLISNRMTPEPNPAIFFNLLWWILGRLSTLLNLGLAQVYQGFRIVAGALYLPAVYAFCALLIESPRKRRVAFLLITFSSGFGWVLVVGKYLTGTLLYPLDIYLPEPNSFLSILAFPHFVISVFLMLVIFSLFIIGARRGRLSYAVGAGLVGLVLGLEHAYDLLAVYGVLAGYTALVGLRRRTLPWVEVKSWGLIVLLSCAPALYFTYLTTQDPIWSRILDQFVNAGVFTPDPFHLIILLGLPFLVAVLTFDGLTPLREQREEHLFLKAWFLVVFVLIYLPVEYQIHFLSGWQIPIAMLATVGLYRAIFPALAESRLLRRLAARTPLRPRSLVAALLVLAVLPTNVYLFAWRFVDLGRHGAPFYLHRDEVAALEWLDANTLPDAVVLSSLTVGQYVPPLAGNTAFLAHWAQTVDFYDKRDRVTRFFDNDIEEADRLETVCTFGVDYVFHGPSERTLGAYRPQDATWLAQAFTTPEVAVYRVERQAACQGQP
ncbi:MAG: hypothetical protein PVI59_11770 [Anaerolineae bacterium]|jgi:hypothetical protein